MSTEANKSSHVIMMVGF